MSKSASQMARGRSRSTAVARTKRRNGVGRASGNAVTVIRPLTAISLKDILWETLTDLKHENILPNRADAIAAQSREILRTIKIQLQVAGQAKRSVPEEIIEFSERR
jgi:nucleotide-binding universal stress UspA family protein